MSKKIRNFTFLFVLVVAGFLSLNASNPTPMINKKVVTNLNIEKYLGTWYEIARFDHRFERGLVGVTANYSMREDGKIKVVNSGFKGSLSGKYTEAVGKAKIPDPINNPAKLKVSFFWFFYADYYVMELDTDYQWALIGSKSDKYLWILSRTPQLEKKLYDRLLNNLENRGYDVSKLIKVEQKSMN